jgi:hypothetical protein
MKPEFSRQISEKILKLQVSRKSLQWKPELFHAFRQTDRHTDRQTDRQTDVTILIIAFHSFANAPKKIIKVCSQRVLYFTLFLQYIAIISLYAINEFVSVVETDCLVREA